MESKKRLFILLRVVLAVILGTAGVLIVVQTPYWMVSVWLFVFFVLSIVDLIRVIERTDRDLTNLLLSIKQGDFTNTYPERHPKSDQLYRSFNMITQEFRKLRREKESSFHFLQAVVEHCGVPLLTYEVDSERITVLNEEAKQLFGIPHFTKLETLHRVDPQLVACIRSLRSGNKVMLKIQLHGQPHYLSVVAKEVVLEQQRHKLIALHNINTELDQVEIESWQKLIRILSHEIKNSVIPISTLAEVISGMLTDMQAGGRSLDSLSSEDGDDLILSVKTIEKRSKGLVKFVSSYGDLAKVPQPEMSEVSVQELIQEAIKLHEGKLKEWDVKLSLILPKMAIHRMVDKDLMSQVLINLIKNATEAMQEQGERNLELELTRHGDQAMIRLTDSGPGIEAEVLENIFVPFFTTKKEGSGIGLSLSRQILKAHGGGISVVSAPGKGTTFKLRF